MNNVTKRYLLKFDEINRLNDELKKELPKSFEELKNEVTEYMIDAFLEGYAAVGYMLTDEIKRQPDMLSVMDILFAKIAGKTMFERLGAYYNAKDTDGIRAVLETEYHRMYVNGELKRASDMGEALQKRWVTVLDNRRRPTHRYLEGMTVGLSDEFFTFDGDHAQAPGLFQKAENNVGCRCILEIIRN